MRSGFAAVTGRPNVGKSTLVNAMVGTKVSITSPRPNTTRLGVRGILHRPGGQAIFVDTPGVHRPRTALGERLNETAASSLEGVDVVVAVVEATAPIGPGDRLVLGRAVAALGRPGGPSALLVAVNKVDRARPEQVLERLASVAELVDGLLAGPSADGSAGPPPVPELLFEGPGDERGEAPDEEGAPMVEYFPVSAATGQGVEALVEAVLGALPEGPAYYPADMVTDTPEAVRVAELVREQLLAQARDELPHSIACRVTEWEWPYIRCEIVVERESQKGIVIGRGGEVLKAVGSRVREQLPEGAFLDLFVRVERHWQQRDDALDRFGY